MQPEPHTQPTEPLTEQQAAFEAARLIADAYSDGAPAATRYADTRPLPTTGDAMPWPQPGRPPMSQRATDLSGLMVAGGIASLPAGAAAALVTWAVGQANPVSLAVAGSAPVALVLAVAVVARCLRGVSLHTEEHHHFQAPVVQYRAYDQRTARGVIARTGDNHRNR
ncbi:hypothetical protein ACWGS5_13600 [Streptomyces albidoflavus]|uniref:hypothetical protein n=1 Tax=unclassified Streptomyces TaxID=2593676 RepID=UPI000647B2BD|nr:MULTISPECIES: hypothetical protein [unclassified Streptomyces]MCG5121601.1 hypothetical protein [Streptomyces sp. T7(2022)]MCK2145308.1 hypothetical protein [Streptomyces sp. WAC00276]